jgi:Holliday junction resolvase RusA-like endonuclease
MRIFIPGDPVAQPRPKVSTVGGFARAYVDAKHPCHAMREAIKLIWQSQVGRCLTGPVSVRMVFWFERPKGHSKTRRFKSEPKASRPDIDNLCKLVMDGLNGVAYDDDGQVYWLFAEKRYVGLDDQPGTEVIITEAGAN